ncbi:hypothetical protein [Borrelia persica]|uniref:hypothetical protein n=1 Tax=Borrelia persica TaxID=44448 RepID=UPI000462F476|nr:hypothetical protein [Borrelia persica]
MIEYALLIRVKPNDQGKFAIEKMQPYESNQANENDIYPIIYNLHLPKNQPTIHLIGDKIYKNIAKKYKRDRFSYKKPAQYFY